MKDSYEDENESKNNENNNQGVFLSIISIKTNVHLKHLFLTQIK